MAVIQGYVIDTNGNKAKGIRVVDQSSRNFVLTNDSGFYKIAVFAGKGNVLMIGADDLEQEEFVQSLEEGRIYRLDIKLLKVTKLAVFSKSAQRNREKPMVELDPKFFDFVVGPSGNIETILKTLGPVSSNNELSSQYNVRGGNFDENLVYVNDIEIYRPQLVRSGQQEGLSFANPDMVQSLTFSAGGFEAKYGDKMSSVMDVTYKDPRKNRNSVNANLMGVMASMEGISKNRKFTYIAGFRYRNTAYILNSLDTRGDYKPRFTDLQTLLKWNLNSNWHVSFLGSLAQNRYLSIPLDRTTNFGTVNQAMQLSVYFQGTELTKYLTTMGGLTFGWTSSDSKCKLKFIASGSTNSENEYFDVISAYSLSDLENNMASENFGKPKALRGYGVFFTHGRNDLNINVLSFQHKGSYYNRKVQLLWGANIQQEQFVDRIHEWNFYDSAEFIVPFIPGPILNLKDVLITSNTLTTHRIQTYVQNTTLLDSAKRFAITYGVRASYNDITEQILISPRINISLEPNRNYNKYRPLGTPRKKDILYRLSGGVYYQPPFYREFRDRAGVLNLNLKAQRSLHIVLGSDYNFKAWNRPFKFVAETYYKKYDFLIPYDIDNVKIRYYAQNAAQGYAAGIDLRVNGEFVNELESWASLSIMKTGEDIDNDDYWQLRNSKGGVIYSPDPYKIDPDRTIYDSVYIHQSYLPRPTDQRFNFNIFFQDYLPKFPSYRMSLNLLAGGPLPFGPPNNYKFRNFFRLPPYRRVDIGFIKMIVDENKPKSQLKSFKNIKSMWVALEVFNLLQFNNSTSVFWVKDFQNQQYAVPNYLTGRRLNLHVVVKF